MPPKQNRRRNPRRASYIIAEYTVREGVFRDIVKSIGADGIFINTRRTIAINQAAKLSFPIFDFNHQISVQGKVVRSTPNGFAVEFDTPIKGLIRKNGQLPDIVHEIDRD